MSGSGYQLLVNSVEAFEVDAKLKRAVFSK